MVRRAPARSGGGDRRSGVDVGAAGGHVGVCHHDHGVVEGRPGAGVDETERSASVATGRGPSGGPIAGTTRTCRSTGVWWNEVVVTAT
jgi:hypothetical protein